MGRVNSQRVQTRGRRRLTTAVNTVGHLRQHSLLHDEVERVEDALTDLRLQGGIEVRDDLRKERNEEARNKVVNIIFNIRLQLKVLNKFTFK